jgi:hypothetical protein
MTFEQSIAKLAARITKMANADNCSLQDATDAFKALTTYYATLKKNKATSEEKNDEPDFGSFKLALEDHNGTTEIRSGGGRAAGNDE